MMGKDLPSSKNLLSLYINYINFLIKSKYIMLNISMLISKEIVYNKNIKAEEILLSEKNRY